MTPSEARAILIEKHWSISNLALHWGKRRETVSRIINNPRRAVHWDDAIRGLPKLSRLAARSMAKKRLNDHPLPKRPRRKPKEKLVIQPIFEKGSILVATTDVGSFAAERDEGLVISVMQGSVEPFYKIEWPEGTDIFAQSEIEQLVADTGRMGVVEA